ncbi:hypothetical protein TRICI_004704 [Trichomonascus ciferrii]|uniref:PSP proline-rich domain-containing protein n=1 Tax=Trichomonascus ciferrii TaxID=44093 RepID=A0A642V092_9ASCO|nr:hypothetical protein TRICI_004704 [Trichomonascus ciferrii]
MAEKKKRSKNQVRRERAKAKKAAEREQQVCNANESTNSVKEVNEQVKDDIDYVNDESQAAEQVDLIEDGGLEGMLNDPNFAQYKSIMDRFYTAEWTGGESSRRDEDGKGQIFYSDDEDEEMEDSLTESGGELSNWLSKKKARKLKKPPLAELKAYAPRPDLVEWYDADAPDPQLVVQLKAARGAVPVPEHWQSKRDYLSGKRGIKKAPFDLPDYIKVTGIMDMRDALKEDDQTLRQKMRERVQPKMGQLDVDYQKLHDAFFKFQTKPRLFKYGEVYYEGKEYETDMSKFRPGKISQRLTEALNIPPNAPPPYLLNMQRYGPPPSYPGLKIPGLNAPIPPGAQWGFHPGGYGTPPLDEKGVPLYGDVYGVTQSNKRGNILGVKPETKRWGEMIDDDSDEDEEEDEEEEEREDDETSQRQLEDEEGQGYVDEEAALAAEAQQQEEEEPIVERIELRKNKPQSTEEVDDDGEPRQLYQVLEQKETAPTGFSGSKAAYEIPSDKPQRKRRRFEDAPATTDSNNDPNVQKDIDDLIQSEVQKKKHRQS